MDIVMRTDVRITSGLLRAGVRSALTMVGGVQGVPITFLEIDLRGRRLCFTTWDGRQLRLPMPPGMFAMPTNLTRVQVDVEAAELTVFMVGGPAVVELRKLGASVATLQGERPLLYLDQGHWSTMAAARHGHRPVRPEEAEAGAALAELVESRVILMPVSAANLVETTPMYGTPRVALASTVLGLGRGWQMRNPLHVRPEEILRAVKREDARAAEVFAPAADLFFSEPSGGLPIGSSATTLEHVMAAVPQVLGLYDAVIDEDAIPDEGGRAHALAEKWAQLFAGLATELQKGSASAEVVRRAAHANLLVDMTDDLLRVAAVAQLSTKAVVERLTDRDDPVASMPFLSQMRQMLFMRLRNTNQRWVANDLVDIMFLCCAAGYADVVVGERQAIGYLRQARRPAPRARLASSLREALELVR